MLAQEYPVPTVHLGATEIVHQIQHRSTFSLSPSPFSPSPLLCPLAKQQPAFPPPTSIRPNLSPWTCSPALRLRLVCTARPIRSRFRTPRQQTERLQTAIVYFWPDYCATHPKALEFKASNSNLDNEHLYLPVDSDRFDPFSSLDFRLLRFFDASSWLQINNTANCLLAHAAPILPTFYNS